VTNNHVVDGADKVEVKFIDGTTVQAKVVGTDPDSDLAVIKVDVNGSVLKPIELGDSSALIVGQQVFAIGNPFGQQWTLTGGLGQRSGADHPVERKPLFDSPSHPDRRGDQPRQLGRAAARQGRARDRRQHDDLVR